MISKYVKEQKRYTQDELRKIFECTADETVQIIRKLKEYGIVKNVKKSDGLYLSGRAVWHAGSMLHEQL